MIDYARSHSGARMFADRLAAGVALAGELKRQPPRGSLLVLALPRGGVAVAEPVAEALNAPLDVLIVRKIGMPGDPEFAIGAVASGGILIFNPLIVRDAASLREDVRAIVDRERTELLRREQLYRVRREPLDLRNRTVLLVDDGLATGATMLAAVRAARAAGADAVFVAAPVASRQAIELIRPEASAMIVLQRPNPFSAVGEYYEAFEQVSDEDVRRILQRCSTTGAD
jgi:putative phosphoribosyl transferase